MEDATVTAYEVVIGLEVHIQLSTASKVFCGDSNFFGSAPNSQTSAVSLGLPGTLPRLNKAVVHYALQLGSALGCVFPESHAFDRKHYFYPDLPKGYQITQDRRPICRGGSLKAGMETGARLIRIHHIHIEEDAGKSMHEAAMPFSLVDLNRAGTPLLELVTEPDFRSAEEVDSFLQLLQQTVRYLGISDGNMEEGSMRCDINLSLRLMGNAEYGERCEIKNVNSMRFARRAIALEAERQASILNSGGSIQRQTLQYIAGSNELKPMRDKESADDYRYFPEPDLPPVILAPVTLDQIRSSLPRMPWEWMEVFQQMGLSRYDAHLLCQDRFYAEYFEQFCQHTPLTKAAANVVINKIIPWSQSRELPIHQFPLSAAAIAELLDCVDRGITNATQAYQHLWPKWIESPATPLQEMLTLHGLVQNQDEAFLKGLVEEVLAAYPEKVLEYQKGKKGLISFFMGAIMKSSKGKAAPAKVQALLENALQIRS